MPDDRDVGDAALDTVAVDTAGPQPGQCPGPSEQVAPQQRGLAGDRGVGDPHAELDGPDDRVGDDMGAIVNTCG
jgi:hypothetical protein